MVQDTITLSTPKRRIYHGLHVTERGDSVRVTFHLTGKPFFTFDVAVHARDSIRVVWEPIYTPDLSNRMVIGVVGILLGAILMSIVTKLRKRYGNA